MGMRKLITQSSANCNTEIFLCITSGERPVGSYCTFVDSQYTYCTIQRENEMKIVNLHYVKLIEGQRIVEERESEREEK